MNYIGVDIGGTKCSVTLGETDCSGNISVRRKHMFSTPYHDPYGTLSIFADKAAEYSAEAEIAGIGISCGGPLDSRSGVIMSPPNLPGWNEIYIIDYFKERFNVPVYLQNDANACAIAEWRYGAGKGYENVIFLTFGTGLGAGLILGGRLYEGANGMAGEVGHIRLSAGGPEGYGKNGSFEGFCSGAGITRIAKMRLVNGGEALLMAAGSIDGITTKLIAELADGGDSFCREIFAESGRMLGMGLSFLVDIINPEIIVIGSVFARSSHLLKPYAEEVLEKEALQLNRSVCRIVPATLGDDIGDIAALSVAAGGYL